MSCLQAYRNPVRLLLKECLIGLKSLYDLDDLRIRFRVEASCCMYTNALKFIPSRGRLGLRRIKSTVPGADNEASILYSLHSLALFYSLITSSTVVLHPLP